MAEITYIVRRRFKYGKRWYPPGEIFEPAGGKFDDAILRSNLVYADTGKYKQHQFGRASMHRREMRHVRIGEKAAARLAEGLPAKQPAVQVVSKPTKTPEQIAAAKKAALEKRKATIAAKKAAAKKRGD